MKHVFLAVAAMTLLAACAPRPSTSVQQAAQAFGLIGSWATDCSKPTMPGDDRMIFAFQPDGSVSLAFDNGIGGGIADNYTFTAGQVIAPDQIALDGVYGGVGQHVVLQLASDGRLRFFENRDANGRVLVQNGALASGGPAQWSTKCH
ncbi:MAG TPA: hypothetical protein VN805_06990 [Caulobacteraceae bacterium]|nr:hypothetical protein [Caulobacteraceae bacterium]